MGREREKRGKREGEKGDGVEECKRRVVGFEGCFFWGWLLVKRFL